MSMRHRVVVVGGGFAGLQAVRSLRHAPVQITLIDRRNFHLFQPLLYQVATGGLSPANIASPLRSILRRQRNVQVLLGDVVSIDIPNNRVLLRDGAEAPYDTLIVATGSSHQYFGHDAWERLAPGLKTVEDATTIRRSILYAFEQAEREIDPVQVRVWLTFVIVGGGPTGVELAGALSEIANHTLRREFRNINPSDATIVLLDGADRILEAYPPSLSAKGAQALARLGVTVRNGWQVVDVQPGLVLARTKDGSEERIETRTVLWAAGIKASPLGRVLGDASGASTDRAGRVLVSGDLTLPGQPEIVVIGDLAGFPLQNGQLLPGNAPVAIQQGKHAARLVRARLAGKALPPFRYRHLGKMAAIGRSAAVVDLGWVRFTGSPAWLVWLFVHLMSLVQFENRLLVLLQWGWNYFTRNRSARLITEQTPEGLRDAGTRG